MIHEAINGEDFYDDYQLMADGIPGSDWVSVSKEDWILAERSAGFRPKMSSDNPRYMSTCATGGFGSSGGTRGRIVRKKMGDQTSEANSSLDRCEKINERSSIRREAFMEASRLIKDMSSKGDSSAEEFAKAVEALSDAEVEDSPWRNMSSAPLNGRHVILAMRSGVFVWAVQGAYDGRKWTNAADIEGEPLCWMPAAKLPMAFLPWEQGRAVEATE
jgi:hypothetical protein